jgi:hypothetical protein
MKRIYLSEAEKKLLGALSISQYGDTSSVFDGISKVELNAASRRLKELGFIQAQYSEGNNLIAARISDEGAVYLKENPNLENPIDNEDLKRLQKDELEYKKRIRKQESIIRLWKLLNIVVSAIGLIGWLLYFFKIF